MKGSKARRRVVKRKERRAEVIHFVNVSKGSIFSGTFVSHARRRSKRREIVNNLFHCLFFFKRQRVLTKCIALIICRVRVFTFHCAQYLPSFQFPNERPIQY